jgi:hypothetical protein
MPGSRNNVVLLYGHDRDLLTLREWVLASAGLQACVALNVAEAAQAMANLNTALFVLVTRCHSKIAKVFWPWHGSSALIWLIWS